MTELISTYDYGFAIALLTPVYYYLYTLSLRVEKMVTVIELCPNCPHSKRE